jgi:predicted DNA-binding transcriptional regulator YafY
MKPERNRSRVLRLYKMEELILTHNGQTVAQLCRLLKVNRRTIYRDLALMQEIGIPLCKDGSKFTILGTYKVPSYRQQIERSDGGS